MGYNLKVHYMDMPNKIRAFTAKKDDYYTICLNSKLSYEQNIKSLKHELRHIENGDFDESINVDEIEMRTHECFI